MSIVRNPFLNPWKDASRVTLGEDYSVLVYAKCVGVDGATSGTRITDADITVSSGVVTFQIDEDGGGLGSDAGIDYTSQAGADGTITITDTNANTPQKWANIINGVGVGQTAFNRWKAVLGDFYPAYALTSGDALDRSATKALVGRYGTPVPLYADGSGLATRSIWAGIGTYPGKGSMEGFGAFPDFFEDIPGSSTTASVNTALRSSAVRNRLSQEEIQATQQVRITGWSFGGDFDTTQNVVIYDIDGNVVYQEATTAGSAITFQDRSERPITGPVGSPLFFSVQGTGTYADGVLSVRAERRYV